MKIPRPSAVMSATQPQLQPDLLRRSAVISQYFIRAQFPCDLAVHLAGHKIKGERNPFSTMNIIPRFLLVVSFLLFALASAPGAQADRRPSPDSIMSLFAATTPSGKTLSAQQLKPLVLHATWPHSMSTRGYWHLKIGVFLLTVRTDGTVANVEKLQSTGHRGLDGEVKAAFMTWRFRPNSVTAVRVPASYNFSWRWPRQRINQSR